jgi:hypothetical protein
MDDHPEYAAHDPLVILLSMASYAPEHDIREGLNQVPDIRFEGLIPVTLEICQVDLDDLVKTVVGFVENGRNEPGLYLNIQVIEIFRIQTQVMSTRRPDSNQFDITSQPVEEPG